MLYSTTHRLTFLLLVGFAVLFASTSQAQETPIQKHLVSVERIWDRADHSAFTDLIKYRGALYCTFREGSGHIPGRNGIIRVLRSDDSMNWKSVALLTEEHVDLRDPKLSITPDGKLMVNSGASYYHDTERQKIESRVAFFDPKTAIFSTPQKVILPESILTAHDWLWRVTWHEGWAWGCVQQVPPQGERSLQLVRSRDGITFELVTPLAVSHPSETTLRFRKDGSMLAMIRRAGEEPIGWIGTSKPPFEEWDFTPSNKRFGGPNFVPLPDGSWLAGSRGYDRKATTDLWWLDPETGKFTDLVMLPSGGDTSYPGFMIDHKNRRVLVAYYSSHEGKAAIYLAVLRLEVFNQAEQ